MKKLLKLFLIGLTFTCLVTALFACGNKNAGLAENDDWKSRPDVVQRNKEAAHAPIISYVDVASAAKAQRESSPYFLSLNGTWDFTLSKRADYIPANFMKQNFVYPDPAAAEEQNVASDTEILYWSTINVPGSWELQGFDAPVYTDAKYPWGSDVTPPNVSENYNPIGLYRREIEIPADWNGREVYISLEGVQTACYVYVNGSMVGYGEDSYTTKDFRITPYIQYGKTNLISLKVIKFSDGAWMESQDSMKLGGIFRDVFLYSAPSIQIKDVFLDPNFDENYENALLQVGVDIASIKDTPKGYTLDIEIYDQEGKTYITSRALGSELVFDVNKTGSAYLANGGGRVTASAPIKWSAETPYLYTAVISLKNANGDIIDIASQKFGFREAGFETDDEGNQLFVVNGVPVKFFGIIYNEHSADTGITVSIDEMTADVKMMKSMNINAIRSPGQPLSSKFLNLCSEYGLYVIDDINIQTTPWANKGDQSIPGDQTIWQTAVLDRMINILERDKNNPSVIMWSLANQSGAGSNFGVMKTWLQQNDARLIIYDGSNVVSDITTAVNWDFNQIYDYINNTTNKKPMILQYFDKGLLNSAGNIRSYVDFFTSYKNAQGGFFANWIDYAIWWPIQTENIADTLKNTPRSANPELYQLTYSGSWGESIGDGWSGLAGIMNADRTPQSDAAEFKRAFSPIYVNAIDTKLGSFSVTNRNANLNFEDNYVIEYAISAEDKQVSTGTVDGITLNPGETKNFNISYGTLNPNTEYFVDITVKYKNKPVWADSEDVIVSSMQYDITGFDVMPKTSGESNTSGSALSVTIFDKPQIYTSAIDIATGKFYFSNNSLVNFNDVYTLSYKLWETNNFWKVPRPMIYAKETLANFDVPSGAKYKEIILPYSVKAVENGTYVIEVTLTTKVDIGDVKAGYTIVNTYDQNTLGSRIPFEINISRTPVPVLDLVTGEPMVDKETGLPIMEGGDPEPPVPVVEDPTIADGETAGDATAEVPTSTEVPVTPVEPVTTPVEPATTEVPATTPAEGAPADGAIVEEVPAEPTDYEPFISINNDKVKIRIDSTTGLITQYELNDKNIFASAADGSMPSPIGNLYRNPTGGDYGVDVYAADNRATMLNQSNNFDSKKLVNPIKVNKITDDHYQVVLDYILIAYPYSMFRNYSLDTDYSVTYDIFGDGEIVVSFSYEPTLYSGIPFELSNVITLAEGFETMSWYGRGPGESYPDKLGDTRVSIYKDVNIIDQMEDYLFLTGSGDKSQVRWTSFKDAEGNGILITSDTDTFAMNVSKSYPWDEMAYSRNSYSNSETVVRLIATQRGAAAGNIVDAQYLATDSYVEPGKSYDFSYRITPIDATVDPAVKSKEKITVTGPTISNVTILPTETYALQNATDAKQYLTSSVDTGVSLAEGAGSANQRWNKEIDEESGVADAFRLKSVSMGLYFTTAVTNDNKASSVEVGVGPYIGNPWQNWIQDDNNELIAVGVNMSANAITTETGSHMGTRIALMQIQGKTEASWVLIPDAINPDQFVVQNAASGYYLSIIDELTYRNPVVVGIADRMRNYPPSIDWSLFESLSTPKPVLDEFFDGNWVPTDASVTQWQLLPSDNQRWSFVPVSGNEYRIVNNVTGNALSVSGNAVIEEAVSTAEGQVWQINNDGGLISIISKTTGLALGTTVTKVAMTQHEMDILYIKDPALGFKDAKILSLSNWKKLPSQQWDLQSSDDLKIKIEAGDDWFYVETPESDEFSE